MTTPRDDDSLARALEARFGAGTRRTPLERASESAELARGLARARAELLDAAGWSERRERRWRAELFTRTTRQDPSWRGDCVLAWHFLRQRLAASPALRVVAASLALHVVAAPVVAYWVLREPAPERRITLRVEAPAETPFTHLPERSGSPEDELVRLAREREARDNEFARTRFVLGRLGRTAPSADIEREAPLELALLAARARALHADAQSRRAPEPVDEASSPLAVALWLELALDHLAVTGEPAPALGATCARASALATDDLSAGVAALVASAVGRARRLGVLEPGTGPGQLFTPEWFEALRRAGEETGLAQEGLWRAWIAWSGKQAR